MTLLQNCSSDDILDVNRVLCHAYLFVKHSVATNLVVVCRCYCKRNTFCTIMSACSSQLSASLLGDSLDEADSASTADRPRQKATRSASAGRLHITTKASASISSQACSSKSRSHRRVPTGRSPEVSRQAVTPRSPALPAESVASQGRNAAKTPQSSGSTGQSHATSGSGNSSKPRWRKSTAASSRHQQSSLPAQGSKSSFLNRLQAQGGPTASDRQVQLDAKAAEMKAKLQEWRQQQKQQKQQQQQQKSALGGPGAAPAKHTVDSARKAPLHHTRPSGTAAKGRSASADTE